MVAIIEAEDLAEVLKRRSVRNERRKYTVAWRQSEWTGGRSQLALLLDKHSVVRWLGRAVAKVRVTDRDRRVEISDIEEFAGISLDILRRYVYQRSKHTLPSSGLLPENVATLTVEGLIDAFPHLDEVVRRLSQSDGLSLPEGVRGQFLNEQRDQTGLLLEIEGFSRELLREVSVTPQTPSFLSGLPRNGQPRYISEATVLTRDLNRFPGLVEAVTADADWRLFEGGGRRLFILSSDREPIEKTTGTDMVYFNETMKSFVLVQYKRAIRDRRSTRRSELWYYADKNLDDELERMRMVDELYGGKPGDFRLFDQACWLKICEPDAEVENPAELMKGMYLAREHFVDIFENQRGPKDGRRIGYENAPRYINNTLFVQLLKDGWIGTRGTGTEQLGEIVAQVLASRRAITLGISMRSTTGV